MVCRRSQIIEEVWDIHFDYNTGVVDVYINALRKKLQLTDAAPYIQTVRGVGYLYVSLSFKMPTRPLLLFVDSGTVQTIRVLSPPLQSLSMEFIARAHRARFPIYLSSNA